MFPKVYTMALVAALCCCFAVQAAEPQGKWIHYGKNTLNANQHASVSLLNPLANADEAKVAAMIADAKGPISLTIGIQFTQPAFIFYTLNARVSDPKVAMEASNKANQMYKAIQQFLKSNDTYLELGE